MRPRLAGEIYWLRIIKNIWRVNPEGFPIFAHILLKRRLF
jgi:hypothetical protein